jgi:hypothetical protein
MNLMLLHLGLLNLEILELLIQLVLFLDDKVKHFIAEELLT